MSEDRIPVGEAEEEQAYVPTAAEEKAMSSGWVNEEDWVDAGNDPDEWVDAKTFNRNGEFMSQIHRLKRQNTDLTTAVNELKNLQGKVAENERKKVLEELKEAKALALENDDHKAVVDIDEQLAEVKDIEKQAKQQQNQPQVDPNAQAAFFEWQQQNPWYNDGNHPEERQYADLLGESLTRQGLTYQEIFDEVNRKVRKNFPNTFKNPNRGQSAVESGSSQKQSKGSRSKPRFNDLPDEAQQTAKLLERLGVMSKADYAKDYFGEQ